MVSRKGSYGSETDIDRQAQAPGNGFEIHHVRYVHLKVHDSSVED